MLTFLRSILLIWLYVKWIEPATGCNAISFYLEYYFQIKLYTYFNHHYYHLFNHGYLIWHNGNDVVCKVNTLDSSIFIFQSNHCIMQSVFIFNIKSHSKLYTYSNNHHYYLRVYRHIIQWCLLQNEHTPIWGIFIFQSNHWRSTFHLVFILYEISINN